MPLDFRPKLDKIIELLLYLAHKRPGADKYQAVKFLYLADREHLNRYGRPITQEAYVAMKYGPVASTALDLLNANPHTLKWAGIKELPFHTEEKQRPNNTPLTYIREPKREVDTDLFSKSDLRVFDEIIEKFGDRTFEELYTITHRHFAYERAWRDKGAAYASAMRYEEMIESDDLRKQILDDLGPVSGRM